MKTDPVSLDDVGVGEIDGDLQGILRHRRVQHERGEVVHAELELAEEAGPLRIEAELAAGQIGKIASPVRHEEALLVFEDELGQIGGETRDQRRIQRIRGPLPAGRRVRDHAARSPLGHLAYAAS
jgi:hypothetical protein